MTRKDLPRALAGAARRFLLGGIVLSPFGLRHHEARLRSPDYDPFESMNRGNLRIQRGGGRGGHKAGRHSL